MFQRHEHHFQILGYSYRILQFSHRAGVHCHWLESSPVLNNDRRLRRDLEVLQKSGNPQILVRPAEEFLWILKNFDTKLWVLKLWAEPSPRCLMWEKRTWKLIHAGQSTGVALCAPCLTRGYSIQQGLLPWQGDLPSSISSRPTSHFDDDPQWTFGNWEAALPQHDRLSSWELESRLVGWNHLGGFALIFISDEKGYGSVRSSEEQRKLLAEKSWETNAESAVFQSLFPDFLGAPETVAADLPAVSHVSSDSPERLEEGLAMETVETRSERSGSELECWICRDVTDEPLIQPCRCRGSMSGVHASCVEEWIRSHRRTARDDAPPRCSVCHQPYQGFGQKCPHMEYLEARDF